jgi:hypothetical protein
MPIWKSHPKEDLVRYLDGTLDETEKHDIEQHLATCQDCQAHLSFVKEFHHGLARLSEEEFTSQEPCPDSWTLVSYEAGEVDEETARHLRVHLLFCDDCAEEFYALRRLRTPTWTKLILLAAGSALKCMSFLGSGTLLQPEYSEVRGAEPLLSSDQIRIEDIVVDPHTEESATVRLQIVAELKARYVSISLETELPRPDWKVYLLDAEEKELASIPLASRETAIGSDLPYGSYTVTIRRGSDHLASFAIEIHAA